MTHTIRTLAAVAALSASVFAAAPAVADVRPIDEGGDYQSCVTEDEFDAFHIGMSEHRVQRLFDTKGRRVSHGLLDAVLDTFTGTSVDKDSMVRSYSVCPEDSDGAAGDDRVLIEFSTRTDKHRALSGAFGL